MWLLWRRQLLAICISQSTVALSRMRDVCVQHMLMMIVCNWQNARNAVMPSMDTNSQNIHIFDIYTRNSRKHNSAIVASAEEAATHTLYIRIYIYIYQSINQYLSASCHTALGHKLAQGSTIHKQPTYSQKKNKLLI